MDPIMLKGLEEAIRTAAAQGRGYESILVIIAFVAMAVSFGWVFRNNAQEGSKRIDKILADAADREKRMGDRINILEDIQRQDSQTLAKDCRDALAENAAAIDKLNTTLERSPCLWSAEKRNRWMGGEGVAPSER